MLPALPHGEEGCLPLQSCQGASVPGLLHRRGARRASGLRSPRRLMELGARGWWCWTSVLRSRYHPEPPMSRPTWVPRPPPTVPWPRRSTCSGAHARPSTVPGSPIAGGWWAGKGRWAQADFARVVTVNLVGTFLVCRAAATVMQHNDPESDGERGVIVNTASIAPVPGRAPPRCVPPRVVPIGGPPSNGYRTFAPETCPAT